MKKIIIQFNEANFDIIEKYANKYNFASLKKIISSNTQIITNSEKQYENLEPWIQWYSFYTSKSFDQHKVFHLNDGIKKNDQNFLDEILNLGKSVGIFGSMNLPPNLKYNIYIPDPWSNAQTDNSYSSKLVNRTIKQLVNKNTKLKIDIISFFGLIYLFGFPSLSKIKLIFKVIKILYKKERPKLASYFDLLFFKYALRRIEKKKLDYSLIFLNGLAHVQHHFLLNSEFLVDVKKNPEWYLSKKKDPIYESLAIYNKIFEYLFSQNSNIEYWIVTGLSQEPDKYPKIYWRFNDHKKILSKFLEFEFSINPLMTRDFEIKTNDKKNMLKVIDFLKNSKIRIPGNNEIYNAFGYVNKNSYNTVFASFIYSGETREVEFYWNYKKIILKNNDLNFVAVKNSIHNQKGWVFSNNIQNIKKTINIWDLNKIIFSN